MLLAVAGDGRAVAGAQDGQVKPKPVIHDAMPAWKEVRWVILRVLILLALLLLYIMLGGPM